MTKKKSMSRREGEGSVEADTSRTAAENESQSQDAAFTQSFDAVDWARAFVAHVTANPAIATDEGTMIGWFANALMRGWDERARRDEPTFQALATTLAALKALLHEVDQSGNGSARDFGWPDAVAASRAAIANAERRTA